MELEGEEEAQTKAEGVVEVVERVEAEVEVQMAVAAVLLQWCVSLERRT